MLSFCMLNRDGGQTIRDCLQSVAAIADEMIVVDTGSTDGSIEIARELGATVLERPWRDDFSAARNEYLSLARGEWILSLDADEILAPCGRDELARVLERDKIAYRFTISNYFLLRDYGSSVSPGEMQSCPLPGVGITHSHTIRLFPNRAGVSYSYPVHESLVPSLRRLGIGICDVGLAIHHLGFVTGRTDVGGKFKRYLDLGYRKLRDHPGNPLSYLELGKLLLCADRANEALGLFEHCAKLAPWHVDGHYHAAMAEYRLNADEACRNRLHGLLRRFPGDANARYLLAMLDRRAGQYDAAVAGMESLASEQPPHFPTQFHLADAYLKLGRIAQAELALARGRELAPWHASVYLLEAELARANGKSSHVDDILARGMAMAGDNPDLTAYRRVSHALDLRAT